MPALWILIPGVVDIDVWAENLTGGGREGGGRARRAKGELGAGGGEEVMWGVAG
jgi:hypothetical protein